MKSYKKFYPIILQMKKLWTTFQIQEILVKKESGVENNQRWLDLPINRSERRKKSTLKKITRTVRIEKQKKALGNNNLTAELFKYRGTTLKEAIHVFKVWSEEIISSE